MIFEMTLTILILSIVMAVVYAGIASMTNTAAGTNVRLQNLDEARIMMATVTKDIRTATSPQSGTSAFVNAAPTDLQFYANLNNVGSAASLVHVYIDASTQLVETVTPATVAGGGSCATWPCLYNTGMKTRFVGRYAVNTAANPLFTYLDVNRNPIGNGTLTAAQLDSVRWVQVSLSVSKTQKYNTAVMSMENTVGLPNVAYQQNTG
ncbi:MAG TPA: hypothetical protein VIC35_03445 [Acidimicrobiia bacterium]